MKGVVNDRQIVGMSPPCVALGAPTGLRPTFMSR